MQRHIKRILILNYEGEVLRDKIPCGYINVETRGNNGNLHVFIDKFNDKINSKYNLYAVRCYEEDRRYVFIDKLNFINGRCSINFEFNSNNVAKSGHPIGFFNVFAVVDESQCVMAAYTKDKVDFKSIIKDIISPKPIESNKLKYKDEEVLNSNNSIRKTSEVTKEYEVNNYENYKCNGTCSVSSSGNLYTPCFDCFNKPEYKTDDFKVVLNNNFTRCTPFKVTRSDYEWWEIFDISLLENILLDFNFNMMQRLPKEFVKAMYNEKYFILGMYKNTHFVFGLPSGFKTRKNPSYGDCVWVSEGTSAGRYGQPGYWILYLEIINH